MSPEDTDPARAGADSAGDLTVVASGDDHSELRLVAYELPTTRVVTAQGSITLNNEGNEGFELMRADPGRHWMNATNKRFANKCLPMLIANQSGWLILNNHKLTFRWNGGAHKNAVEFIHHQNANPYPWAVSHFGHGIVTWYTPFLFRTSPGHNLLVRGPANQFKDGIAPLEGVVETDWLPAAFTINWKITRPGWWITFEPGEPLCMLVPQRRGELETFHPQILPLDAEPELQASYESWLDRRAQLLVRKRDEGNNGLPTADAEENWHKHYLQGRSPDGSKAPKHQTRLQLRSFARSEVE